MNNTAQSFGETYAEQQEMHRCEPRPSRMAGALRRTVGEASALCTLVICAPVVVYQYVQARRLNIEKHRCVARAKSQLSSVLSHGRQIGSRHAEIVGAAAAGGLIAGLVF